MTLFGFAVFLLAVSLISYLVQTRRATAVSPLSALKAE